MNYLKEILAFERLQDLHQLSAGQARLWYTLLYLNNISGWQEWFTVASSVLENRCSLSRSGIVKARDELIEKGYIEFRSNGRKAGSYHINDLTRLWQNDEPSDGHSQTDDTSSHSETANILSVETSTSTSTPATQPSSVQTSKQSPTPLNKLNKTKTKPNTNQHHPSQSLILWNRNWGRPTSHVQSEIEKWVGEFGDELVQWAIKAALDRSVGKKGSVAYVKKMLTKYRQMEISTVEQAEEEAANFQQKQQRASGRSSWHRPRRVEKLPSWKTEQKPVHITSPEQEAEVKKLLAQLHADEEQVS